MRKIKFYLKCIKATWRERENKTCRNKIRRLARKFESFGRECLR